MRKQRGGGDHPARRRLELEERAGAVEGDLAPLDGRESDGMPDGVHEWREPGGGLAHARVVEAHEPAAARRVAGVLLAPLPAVPVLVPVPRRPPAPPAPAAALVVVFFVFFVADPVLLLDGGLVEVLLLHGGGGLVELLLQPRQHPAAPHPGADEAAHAARLVGQVELRAAEHLGGRRLGSSQEEGGRHQESYGQCFVLHDASFFLCA